MIDLKTSLRIRPYILMMLLLSLVNLVLYWPVQDFEFIILDDPAYVLSNAMVQNGLTLDGIKWAFTTFDRSTANWHPLTWLSLMLDWRIFGMNAGGYHWTNLLFHMANTLLLFVVLQRMTDELWRSAFVAVLFAVHPLHVESVAWVSERKDVLCAFFWLLATGSYLRYIAKNNRTWYFFTLFLFSMSLMSKPMAVTFPFALLLLDFWPLGRFRQQSRLHCPMAPFRCIQRSTQYLFFEKVPFFVLSTIASIITFLAQLNGEAIKTVTNVPLALRVSNAAVAYLAYIGKMIWPYKLAVYYPLQDTLPLWQVSLAATLILSITALIVFLSRRYPYLFTGWFWYIGTLVPVIGLVQVGSQSMADRYTYIPLTGMFIIIAWGAADIIARNTSSGIYLRSFAVFVIGALLITTGLQVQHWRNSLTLFRQTLEVTEENYLVQNGMGVALRNLGDLRGAASHFREAIRIYPEYAEAHNNLGCVYVALREFDPAVVHLREAIRLAPRYEDAHFNLGQAYLMQKKYDDAIVEYRQILKSKPEHAEAHNCLGVALVCQNEIDGAIIEFEAALRNNPEYGKAAINLSNAKEIKNKLFIMSHRR